MHFIESFFLYTICQLHHLNDDKRYITTIILIELLNFIYIITKDSEEV